MKRVFSLMMAGAVVCTLFAGCTGTQTPTTAPSQSQTIPSQSQVPTTVPSLSQGPVSALEVLETVWNQFGEDEQFWVVGGGYNNPVDNAPGTVELTDTDYLTFSLLIPEAQQGDVTEAASMMHAMNGNNFTCGVYKVGDVSAFADAMHGALQNHQWVCGMPELLKIVDLGGGYVMVAFGIGDAMNPFFAKLAAAYPQAKMLVEENVT